MNQRFQVTFDTSVKGWVASLAQTSGLVVLPTEAVVFEEKSLASVEGKVKSYLGALELTNWILSYNVVPALGPELTELLDMALQASEEAEAAEYRKVRRSHRAIEALSAAGFTTPDICVLLGESETLVQEMRRLGRILEDAEATEE